MMSMDANPTSVRTSFIPKTSLSARGPRKEGLGFFTFLAIAILLVSLLGWLAAFSYKSLVEKDVHNLEAYLTKAKESFDPSLLKVFENLDRRLRTSEDLLHSHTALSPLFTLLDKLTLKNVRYTYFSYVNNGSAAAVKMSGEATDFSAIALQALEFSKDGRLTNPIFSNLGVEQDKLSGQSGRITFDVQFNVDQSFVTYAPKPVSALEGI